MWRARGQARVRAPRRAYIVGAVVQAQNVVVGIDAGLRVTCLAPIRSTAKVINGLVEAQECGPVDQKEIQRGTNQETTSSMH